MKIKKYIKYSISIIFIIIAIAILISFYYYKILPEYIFNKTLTEFEEACYLHDKVKIQSMISVNSFLYKYVQNDKNNSLIVLFEKFDKGFKIPSDGCFRMNYTKIQNSEVIGGFIIKNAKKDNKERMFGLNMIIKENNKWKIVQYVFPDYINY